MAMVVQHNITAMNSNRQLGVTTGGQAKSSEKLSSGYKINRAGDDAAGLKISEKMRSQVRGLNRASTNAQDGVSLIQTAEGALNEVHSILQRMNELAVQGSNDTNQDIDRDAINEELAALTTEIDRIASTTQFNKQELLDGGFEDKKLHVGANVNQNIAITIEAMNADAIGLNKVATVMVGEKTTRYSYNGVDASTIAGALSAAKQSVASAAGVGSVGAFLSATQATSGAGGNARSIYSIGGVHYNKASAGSVAAATSAAAALRDASVKLATSGIISDGDAVARTSKTETSITVSAPAVDTYEMAQATLSKIQDAINKVSSQRSALGALQNRLEHTIANLDNVAENTQAAESRIRDTDMASEMVEYSKNNILAQAGQSMLAQANQSTQGVLSLLQ